MDKNKSTIVISAINFTEGGPLTILNECLEYASIHLSQEYNVVALVHDKDMFSYPNVRYISFPRSKNSWITRIYYEYFFFKKVSDDLKPYLWLSLHDITPNVKSTIRAVYCHNSSPFFRLPITQAFLDVKFYLFSIFYSFLYRINIHKNNYVIVQQEWLRKEFVSRFSLSNVVVAYPEIHKNEIDSISIKNTKFTFLYPAFPRVFKNFEVICKAADILSKNGMKDVEFILTIDGSENRYSNAIVRNNNSPLLKFVGIQKRESLYDLYAASDCLIFPSKLETWGLPLTEYMVTGKPLLAADLPYAHETVGEYNKVNFFDPDDAEALALLILDVIKGDAVYEKQIVPLPSHPFVSGWGDLFEILLK